MKEQEYVSPHTGEIVSKEQGDEFATVLLNMAGGASHLELSDELAALVKAVQETGRAGYLNYRISVKPAGKNLAQSTVILSDKITAKKPEFEREASMFFADDTGKLHRNNPNQPSLWAGFDTEGNE